MQSTKYILRITNGKGEVTEVSFSTAAAARAAVKLLEISATEREIPLGIEELAAVGHG